MVGAVVVGVFLVTAALAANTMRPVEYDGSATPTLAVINNPSLFGRQALAERDSNQDGRPDWQDMLGGVAAPPLYNQRNSSSAPEVLTDQIGINVFQAVVSQRSRVGMEAVIDSQRIVEDTAAQVSQRMEIDILEPGDITIIPEVTLSTSTVIAYYNDMALAMQSSWEGDFVLDAMLRVVNQRDVQAEQDIKKLSREYDKIVERLLKIAVPEPLVTAHLDLVNTMLFIRDDLAIFADMYRDPILTVLHLQRFQQDISGFRRALLNFVMLPGQIWNLDHPSILGRIEAGMPLVFFAEVWRIASENNVYE